MDLLFDLVGATQGIWIDGSHRVFEKTEFEGLKFKVKIKPLTRTEFRRIRREAQTVKGIENDMIMPRIFSANVLDWELKDAKGEMIPFSEENKKVICETFPTFANLISAACLDSNVKACSEDEIKNSLTSGTGN
jgi:hypothetical protein